MRKQDYYEPSTGCESGPRRRPKKKKKRRQDNAMETGKKTAKKVETFRPGCDIIILQA